MARDESLAKGRPVGLSKLRLDSWAAPLTEEQRWALYYRSRTCKWHEAAQFAVREFGLEAAPGRTAFYRWLSSMREQESAHRLEQAAQAAAEMAALSQKANQDQITADGFKALAVNLALSTGNAKDAVSFLRAAVSLQEQSLKKDKLSLDLAKFEATERRLNAVQEAVKSAKQDGGLSEEALRKIEEAAGLL